jgi:hypothetical protein
MKDEKEGGGMRFILHPSSFNLHPLMRSMAWTLMS